MSGRVAYLVNQYPKVSHTFIKREIQALERTGLDVARFAVRGWRNDQVDPEDAAERDRTRYLLRGGVPPLIRAFAWALSRRPLRLFGALRRATALAHRADRPLWTHLVYLLEACLLARWLRENGATHLHAHFGTNAATVALLCRTLGGPPFSFTVHGPEEFDRPAALKLREKAAEAAFVVTISQFGRSQLMRWLQPRDWPKVTVVHCGLDAASRPLACRLAGPGRPVLACVGRLVEQKGQLLLIEAVARLRRDGIDFELALVGDGEMRPDLERAVSRHGLNDVVRITGWVSSARVRHEIARATALVLPSFAEGLPVVLMEAMAMGRPVISTWVAGIPELVQDGRQGWLVPAGSVDALANAMRQCLQAEPEALERMGREGRTRVMERHDADEAARRLALRFGFEAT